MLHNKMINLIFLKNTYKRNNKSLSSFLINPEKKDNN